MYVQECNPGNCHAAIVDMSQPPRIGPILPRTNCCGVMRGVVVTWDHRACQLGGMRSNRRVSFFASECQHSLPITPARHIQRLLKTNRDQCVAAISSLYATLGLRAIIVQIWTGNPKSNCPHHYCSFLLYHSRFLSAYAQQVSANICFAR